MNIKEALNDFKEELAAMKMIGTYNLTGEEISYLLSDHIDNLIKAIEEKECLEKT